MKRERFDVNTPGAREMADRIVHGAFVTEGTMIAFPTCFPAVTEPIPADESHITALDITPDGLIYAGTSGRAAHLLVGMFHGVTGMVFDMGTVEGGEHTAAICCGQKGWVAAVNGPAGGRLLARELEPLPFDLIQEWHIHRRPFADAGMVGDGARIVHMISNAERTLAVGITEQHLFTFDFTSSAITLVAPVAGRGRLARGAGGSIFGLDERDSLWRYDPASAQLIRQAIPLPPGTWDASLRWASDVGQGMNYLADAEGRLFSFSEQQGFSPLLAQAPVPPISAMAVTFDGRLFGCYGDGMAKLFCFDPRSGTFTSLGVAVSIFERRRYGYAFADAVVGRDGEIVFAEDDDLGHLWLYFPRIQAQ